MRRFLLADDHFVVRNGLRRLIVEEFRDAQIDECKDWDSAWSKIKAGWFDLVILEINMPGAEAIGLLRNLFVLRPGLKVLIFTKSNEEIYAKTYLQLGVKGFINKAADAPEIRHAIHTALSNEKYLSPKVQNIFMENVVEGTSSRPFDALSSRELAVMTYLIKGINVSQIADMLSLTASTIATHKAKVMKKLGVANVMEMYQLFDNA